MPSDVENTPTRPPHRLPLDYFFSSRSTALKEVTNAYPETLYQSLALDSRDREIRLLDLDPGRGALTGRLRVARLQATSCPEYQALSYTWGSASPGKEIRLNGDFILPLTDNLFNALVRLRRHFKALTLWIDAVCINQASNDERGRQVAIMDKIFRNATAVIVWLGETSAAHNNASGWWSNRGAAVSSALQTTEPRWHERAWITQEFIHARKRYICAGSTLFEYEPRKFFRDMHKVPHRDSHLEALEQKLARMKTLSDRWIEQEQGGKPDMYLYLRTFRQTAAHATDSRDLVYSLLSLISPAEAALIGSDYNITTGQVYAKATYASFVSRHDFDILAMKDLTSIGEMPTWALDFSAPPISTALPTTVTYRKKDMEPTDPIATLSSDFLTLHIWGHHFDTIHATMPVETSELSDRSIFSTALFHVLRNMRSAIKDTSREICFPQQMASFLTSIPDPDLDSWVLRILEEMPSIRKVVITALFQYWNKVFDLPERLQHCKDIDEDLLEYFYDYCLLVSTSQNVFITESGFIGVAPTGIAQEDTIVLVPDARHAVILRNIGAHYTFCGLGYVHGIVDGQLVQFLQDGAASSWQEFVLK